MTGATADQIVQRIANVNRVEYAVIRPQVEQNIHRIMSALPQDYSELLETLYPDRTPTMDELIYILEFELYEIMIPKHPGWEWIGYGYRRIQSPEHQRKQDD